MYETAIPDDTKKRLKKAKRAKLVVGIPSYRNTRTVRTVVEQVAMGLDQYYAKLKPLIVHADGHSFDKTLLTASQVPLPKSVRRIPTRYQGLPGKGSALRVIFEIATHLQAEVVLLVEADVVSFASDWLPTLVEPVLKKKLEIALPLYQSITPQMASSDLIIYPLLSSMFNIPLRCPTAGEVAIAGGVVKFFSERDVWETNVARAGIDVWMTVQIALGEGRLGQVYLPTKRHRSQKSHALAEAKFLQEIGTLFRMGQLHERGWHGGGLQPKGITTLGEPEKRMRFSSLPNAVKVWQSGKQAIKKRARQQWEVIMLPQHLATVQAILNLPEAELAFDDQFWARLVYDFLVVYNLGEGDPDKVVTSLYPLYLLRHAAMLKEAAQYHDPHLALEQLIQRQLNVFHNEFDYLVNRWEGYVSPEQLELWRRLGLLG